MTEAPLTPALFVTLTLLVTPRLFVTPAQAGVQAGHLDSRCRGNDEGVPAQG